MLRVPYASNSFTPNPEVNQPTIKQSNNPTNSTKPPPPPPLAEARCDSFGTQDLPSRFQQPFLTGNQPYGRYWFTLLPSCCPKRLFSISISSAIWGFPINKNEAGAREYPSGSEGSSRKKQTAACSSYFKALLFLDENGKKKMPPIIGWQGCVTWITWSSI